MNRNFGGHERRATGAGIPRLDDGRAAAEVAYDCLSAVLRKVWPARGAEAEVCIKVVLMAVSPVWGDGAEGCVAAGLGEGIVMRRPKPEADGGWRVGDSGSWDRSPLMTTGVWSPLRKEPSSLSVDDISALSSVAHDLGLLASPRLLSLNFRAGTK